MVEVMSTDSDMWVSRYMMHTIHERVRGMDLVDRQQRGVYIDECNYIRVQRLHAGFDGLPCLSVNPSLTTFDRCVPLLVAYFLSGTDFTPTLWGMHSGRMFDAWCSVISNPSEQTSSSAPLPTATALRLDCLRSRI